VANHAGVIASMYLFGASGGAKQAGCSVETFGFSLYREGFVFRVRIELAFIGSYQVANGVSVFSSYHWTTVSLD